MATEFQERVSQALLNSKLVLADNIKVESLAVLVHKYHFNRAIDSPETWAVALENYLLTQQIPVKVRGEEIRSWTKPTYFKAIITERSK